MVGRLKLALKQKIVLYSIIISIILLFRFTEHEYSTTFNDVIKNAEEPINIPPDAQHVWLKKSISEALSLWVYIPQSSDCAPPVVIIANDLGTQKDMGMESFAREFVSLGYAVVLFDYRTFGGSKNDWNIRNYIHPWDHSNDIETIVNFVKIDGLNSTVDTNSIILFGSGYGGAHVISAGVKLRSNISAIISQAPFMEGEDFINRGNSMRSYISSVTLAFLVAIDYIKSFLSLDPIYIKIFGNIDELAYINFSETEYKKLNKYLLQV